MLTKTRPSIKLQDLQCYCGGQFKLLPDEEATTNPPDYTAKLLECEECNEVDWFCAEDFNLDDWEVVEEFKIPNLDASYDLYSYV